MLILAQSQRSQSMAGCPLLDDCKAKANKEGGISQHIPESFPWLHLLKASLPCNACGDQAFNTWALGALIQNTLLICKVNLNNPSPKCREGIMVHSPNQLITRSFYVYLLPWPLYLEIGPSIVQALEPLQMSKLC